MIDWEEIQVISQLVAGLTVDNASDRLGALLDQLDEDDWHVQAIASGPDPLSSGPSDSTRTRAVAVLEAAVAAVRFAAGTDMTSEEMASLIIPLSNTTRERLWLIFGLEREDTSLLNEATKAAFGTRIPTADDARALEIIDAAQRAAFSRALPPPPPDASLRDDLARGHGSSEVIAQWIWLELAGEERPDWAEASAILEERYGPVTREQYAQPPPRFESFQVGSPMAASDLNGKDPTEISSLVSSWRRSPTERHVGTRELARTLQAVVEADPRAWAASPLDYVRLLREPIYVAHYLLGIANAKDTVDEAEAGPFVEAIEFVNTEPWKPAVLGSSDWDYDPNWDSCRDASIDLIEAMAKADVATGVSYTSAWQFLERLALDTTRGSAILSESDPMTLAINRPSTRAFRALLNLAASRHRLTAETDEQLQALLEAILSLDGSTGLQFRAILAPWLPYLRQLLPSWTERIEAYIYSAGEPLGFQTLALAVQWSKPDLHILETQRSGILELVRRHTERALDHVIIAMLRGTTGYEVARIAKDLNGLGPGHLSEGARHCAQLLRDSDLPEEVLERGLCFWEAILETGQSRQRLAGLGWWAEVDTVEDHRWRQLMIRTVRDARGELDWAEQVAERLLSFPDEHTLKALDWLVSGVAEPWIRGQVAQLAIDRSAELQGFADTEQFAALNRTLMMFGLPTLPTDA